MIVHWSREAIEDLVALRTWIGDRNPAAAKRVAAAIERSVDHLGEFPHIGHDGDLPATRELMVPGTPPFAMIVRYAGPGVSGARPCNYLKRR